MRILISNDDGIDAPGLAELAEAAEALGEVWVCAPEQEQSAMSHALTMREPVYAEPRGPRRFAVKGTPADCVYLALHHLIDGEVDLVLSGINRGSNLGSDVYYSGTVAAAREATLHGTHALAVSLHLEPGTREPDYGPAAELAVQLARRVLADGLPPLTLLNLNVPPRPLHDIKGMRAAPLSVRRYSKRVDCRTDPRGRSYYWIGGDHVDYAPDRGADGPLLEAGYAPVTPLCLSSTDDAVLEMLRDWPEL